MYWLDILLLVVLGLAAMQGVRVGLIKSVFALGGLVVGILLALRLYAPLGQWLQQFTDHSGIANAIAFAVIVLVLLLAATLLSSMLGQLVSLTGLGWINRLGGGVFSLTIGTIVVGAILAALLKFSLPGVSGALQQSHIAAFLLKHFPLVLALLPPEFGSVRSFFHPSQGSFYRILTVVC